MPAFQLGKYYRHNGGHMLHIIGAVHTYLYGWVFVAEAPDSPDLKPVGLDADHAQGWIEIDAKQWVEKTDGNS